ncbi:MAG: hypothetical protein ACK48X_19290, partial [Planctomycetota bacterium]
AHQAATFPRRPVGASSRRAPSESSDSPVVKSPGDDNTESKAVTAAGFAWIKGSIQASSAICHPANAAITRLVGH